MELFHTLKKPHNYKPGLKETGRFFSGGLHRTSAGTIMEAMDEVLIERIRCILTAPAGIRLVVVKVATNQAGLYGLGCATFTN